MSAPDQSVLLRVADIKVSDLMDGPPPEAPAFWAGAKGGGR